MKPGRLPAPPPAPKLDGTSRPVEGALTLGQVAERTATLEVACRRCGRHGRYNVVRLVERHGAGMPMPELLRVLAGDCHHLLGHGFRAWPPSVEGHDVCDEDMARQGRARDRRRGGGF